MQHAQATCFFTEFVALLGKLVLVDRITHTHGSVIVLALCDALHKELLDGDNLIEGCISSHIGVAESAARQVALDAILAHLQCSAHLEHRFYVKLLFITHNMMIEK